MSPYINPGAVNSVSSQYFISQRAEGAPHRLDCLPNHAKPSQSCYFTLPAFWLFPQKCAASLRPEFATRPNRNRQGFNGADHMSHGRTGSSMSARVCVFNRTFEASNIVRAFFLFFVARKST